MPEEGTKVKICGVTRPADAELAVSLGADLLGLNFFVHSSRYVEPEAADEIVAAVSGRCRLVGVFVNLPIAEIRELEERLRLDLLQFHGDEEPEDLRSVAERAIKAIRFIGAPDPAEFAAYPDVWGFLVEARHPDPARYGGDGVGWSYEAAGHLARDRPLLLAGGLGPENVGQAITVGRPWGVDVCSGVEALPGRKDADLMKRFFAEVRRAQT